MIYEITEFTAKWCNACKKLEPSLEAAKRCGVVINKVDVEENPKLAEEMGIHSLPTLIFSKNGDRFRTTTGASIEIAQAVVDFGQELLWGI